MRESFSFSFPIDFPLDWLQAQELAPKAYIRSGDEEFAALGCAQSFDTIPQMEERVYGGLDFMPREGNEGDWEDFKPCLFFLPLIEVYKKGERL